MIYNDEVYESLEFRKFKFRELKVYASTEWLADNKKKYRQVFDRYESAYMYAELSLYNKMFDLDDWDVEVELKCFSLKKGRTELCSLPFRRKVSKYDNVIYVREGWGNKKEGAFWKKGTYYWEAYVDGEKVATKYFYIEDGGREVTHEDNPYIEMQSLKLYEGPYDDIPETERLYYRKLHGEETRYIYAEITLKNLNVNKSWQCELFAKFYNNARELKGQIVRLHRVERKDEYLTITAGWGSNVKGSWRNDHYTCEVVFMDKLLAVLPFEVGDEFLEGTQPIFLPNQTTPVVQEVDDTDKVTFDEVMSKLELLIGLSQIKQKVREHAQYLQFLQIRKERGFDEDSQINVHSVFVHNQFFFTPDNTFDGTVNSDVFRRADFTLYDGSFGYYASSTRFRRSRCRDRCCGCAGFFI